MILSVSRRTDIPACYSDWFYNRVKEGFALVRHPMNPHKISRVSLSPDVVDAIVFWTKNPLPLLNRLPRLRDYLFVFHFTVTPYGPDIEPCVPSKQAYIIPAFQRLADTIGPDRVVWRYDPVLLNPVYTEAWHARAFEGLAACLAPFTRKCVISFIDPCRATKRNADRLRLDSLSPADKHRLGTLFAQIAHSHGLCIEVCAEDVDLSACGIAPARCIDETWLEELLGCRLDVAKDKGQRPLCGCAASVDIGQYGTCRYGCLYCYASGSPAAPHNPASALLAGVPKPSDIITERHCISCKTGQISLF